MSASHEHIRQQSTKQFSSRSAFRLATKTWFITTLIGQLGFIAFIVAFYGPRTIGGSFARWNDKQLITGYVAGDTTGNLIFAAHVLLAAVMTLLGLIQLIPDVRRAAPDLHRWSGRLFLVLSVVLALSGIWLTWVRGSQISLHSAIAVTLNGILILIFASLTIRYAVLRQIKTHERWAVRLFMVASGVWFFRVFIMAWMLIGRGAFSLPPSIQPVIDPLLEFGSYLIPLALFEVWQFARNTKAKSPQISMSVILLFATCLMAVGIFGTITMMWLPHL